MRKLDKLGFHFSDQIQPNDVLLSSNTIDFNGGPSSVSGSGTLTLQPNTVSVINLNNRGGGPPNALNINATTLDNYAGGLIIGGTVVPDLSNPNTITANNLILNVNSDLAVPNDLTLIAENGIVLNNGTLSAGTPNNPGQLNLIVTGDTGTITNEGSNNTLLLSDEINLVAIGGVGLELKDIFAQAPSGAGTMQVATGSPNILVAT